MEETEKNNLFSFLKKRLNLPSLYEIASIVKKLGAKEKIVFSLLAIIFLLSAFVFLYQLNDKISASVPSSGGTLKEGIVGTPRFINPLLAISDADRDMISLVYSGLMRSDNKGDLMPDLAEKYEISEDGLEYKFILRPNLKWHDGEPITSDDIEFTISQTKDPILKSPKRASWEGVEVERIDERTVKFILQKPYAPFLENTTLGILPKHLWKDASSELMSFSELNISPIGSGPYKIDDMDKDSSGIINTFYLIPNKNFALGKPYIKNFILKFYPSEEKLIDAYKKEEIDSISAISPQNIEKIKREDSDLKIFFLSRIFAAFFNQNNKEIFAQQEVREALNLATDKKKIINEVFKNYGSEINSPIPPGTFGSLENKENDYSPEEAKKMLEKNGWIFNKKDGMMEKKTKQNNLKLEFSISTSDVPDLKMVAELLKSMWEGIGAKVEVKIFEIGDLNQNIIRTRKYDVLLFGEIVGRDPDPFVFWHSSQRNDPGLNVALYANITADKLLEKARIVSDEEERKKIYQEFQEEIEKDVPAIFLYSPHFIYIIPEALKGLDELDNITTLSERFSQIYRWHLKTNKVWKIFAQQEN